MRSVGIVEIVIGAVLLLGGPASSVGAAPVRGNTLEKPAEAFFEKIPVLAKGDAAGAYAIPKMLVTAKGTVLVLAQDRKGRGAPDNGGALDAVLVRSGDHGRTWSAPVVLDRSDTMGCKPNGIVQDGPSGRVFVFIERLALTDAAGEAMQERWSLEHIEKTRRLGRAWVVRHSDDEGRTWSPPRDITAQLTVKPHWQAWRPTQAGIQLRFGKHKGRLIVPCRVYAPPAGQNRFNWKYHHNAVIYSDDAGQTWTPGGLTQAFVGECAVVELSDGRVYLSHRSTHNAKKMRTHAVSSDGGVSFTDTGDDPKLPDPHCHADMIRYADPAGGQLGAAGQHSPPQAGPPHRPRQLRRLQELARWACDRTRPGRVLGTGGRRRRDDLVRVRDRPAALPSQPRRRAVQSPLAAPSAPRPGLDGQAAPAAGCTPDRHIHQRPAGARHGDEAQAQPAVRRGQAVGAEIRQCVRQRDLRR